MFNLSQKVANDFLKVYTWFACIQLGLEGCQLYSKCVHLSLKVFNASWKEHLERTVGDNDGNNKKGASEILEHLEGCYELSVLSKMTRAEGTGILTFIRVWETKFEKVEKLGVNISDISGIDMLYACNLIKDDRNLIRKDLDALKMIYMRQNVANSIRKCFHHEVLKTEDLEFVRMQELNKEVKHRRFLSWMFFCV